MKKLLLLAAFLGASVSLFAQGTVTFANLASQNYRLTTNSAPGGPNSGLMSGVNAYRIGLYAGPSGSAEGALTLVGIATNSSVPALAGYFNGGSPFTLPAGFATGTEIAFQLRAWSYASGLSYESAAGDPSAALGKSALGFVTPGGGTVLPGALFGTGPGQLSTGFEIAPIIPEPSSIALGLLGLGAIALFRRRK